MSHPPQTFILTGGGTGGHVYPALAIATELKKRRPDARVMFVGTRGKIEARVVPAQGFEFVPIWISGFQRRMRLQNLLFPLKVLVSFGQAFFLIRRSKPAAVIGTGGYVCGPVLAAASVLGIPSFIHESNSYPGVTTRLLASRSTVVFLGFENARSWLPVRTTAEVVGTPTRESLRTVSRDEALAHFGLNKTSPVVLITGGSQGAASINEAVKSGLDLLHDVQLIWQTGEKQAESVKHGVGSRVRGWVGGFVDRMDFAYAAADIIVGRAGATTIAEITRVGKASILVPYPYAAEDHQTHNARSLADAGAAILIPDRDAGSRLATEVNGLVRDHERRKQMAEAALRLGRPDAASVIVNRVLEQLH